MARVQNLLKEVKELSNPQKAKFLMGFFKTDKGQYGFGDKFAGITVPQSRKIALNYQNLPLLEISKLLKSKIHEVRLIALLILVNKFQNTHDSNKIEIFKFYLKNTKDINNWDLVDLSADKIVGGYLLDKDWSILKKLAKSKNLWERRIAIIATFQFIKEKKSSTQTLEIAEILINDKHDLIQKAVGWMLREVGKRISQKDEEIFLKKHYKSMSRTTLRYAIERFPEKLKNKFMRGKI